MDFFTKQMYVPDPQKWIEYYRNGSNGHTNSYIEHANKLQRGGGLMGSPKQFVIPIENDTHTKPNTTSLPKVQLVSPAEQVVQQA